MLIEPSYGKRGKNQSPRVLAKVYDTKNYEVGQLRFMSWIRVRSHVFFDISIRACLLWWKRQMRNKKNMGNFVSFISQRWRKWFDSGKWENIITQIGEKVPLSWFEVKRWQKAKNFTPALQKRKGKTIKKMVEKNSVSFSNKENLFDQRERSFLNSCLLASHFWITSHFLGFGYQCQIEKNPQVQTALPCTSPRIPIRMSPSDTNDSMDFINKNISSSFNMTDLEWR